MLLTFTFHQSTRTSNHVLISRLIYRDRSTLSMISLLAPTSHLLTPTDLNPSQTPSHFKKTTFKNTVQGPTTETNNIYRWSRTNTDKQNTPPLQQGRLRIRRGQRHALAHVLVMHDAFVHNEFRKSWATQGLPTNEKRIRFREIRIRSAFVI